MNPAFLLFWGKAQPIDPAGPAFHPLLAHMLDVAAVAEHLAQAVPGRTELPLATLAFLVALHDIGKVSRPFQAKVPACWPAAALGPLSAPPADPGHDAVGLFLLREGRTSELLDAVLPGWTDGHRAHLLRAVTGHHGKPPDELDRLSPGVLPMGSVMCAEEVLRALMAVFEPPPVPRPAMERDIVRLAWALAGLTTLADWIGSAQRHFRYALPEALNDPGRYYRDTARPCAAAAISASGLAPVPPASFDGVTRLFPGITLPSPVQEWAERVALPDGPALFVIEDLTGAGKTEAAVVLAHRLMADGRADGLFVALPTMATANAMFDRLASAYRRLFAEGGQPSLALAHGRARLDPRFTEAILSEAAAAEAGLDAAAKGSNVLDRSSEEPAGAQCAAWFAASARRALLAQVGVGTLDQALLAVLPVRHAALRLAGLARKVLVVDEVHAFDPYMRRELVALLEFHAALGGSAILLSATLPIKLRRSLAQAFRKGLGALPAELISSDYPLATVIARDAAKEEACGVRPGLARSVAVERLPDAESALARITAAAEAGAAVAWVRNTVDDAIAATDVLRGRGLDPMLFHARYALADRLAIEETVLRRFGPTADPAARQGVLVATQVVEQSLDLDFDLLVTDLAPADLLIQRAGRLWRHARPKEQRPLAGPPRMLVVSPEPVDDPPASWLAGHAGTAAVYRDPALLWRSARAVFRDGAIRAPEDLRRLIEEVADDETPGAVPPSLARAAEEAAGKSQAKTAQAAMNVLDFAKGYRRDAGLWEADTRTPTRLEDRPQVTLRLARVREDGAVVPYAEADDPARAWALSEVMVPEARVAECPAPAGLEASVQRARDGWGRWERDSPRVKLAVLRPTGAGFAFNAIDRRGVELVIRYDSQTGIQWPDAAGAA